MCRWFKLAENQFYVTTTHNSELHDGLATTNGGEALLRCPLDHQYHYLEVSEPIEPSDPERVVYAASKLAYLTITAPKTANFTTASRPRLAMTSNVNGVPDFSYELFDASELIAQHHPKRGTYAQAKLANLATKLVGASPPHYGERR
jgi:hypothetical protein